MKGVNLGGWLVLERWITPSLFAGMQARDEYGFCSELGDKAADVLPKHWESYITADDFAWLKQHGVDAVRIPVGYWLFGDQAPFVGNVQYLDWAFKTAAEHNIGIVIDLHGLPGSQNGNDHSGKQGKIEWHLHTEYRDLSLEIVERLAERYAKQSRLLGIQVANEPDPKIPHKVVVDYYQQAYQCVRRHCGPDVAVIISDAFRPRDWLHDLIDSEYQNVWLDMHLYRAFGKDNERQDIHKHLLSVKRDWPQEVATAQEAHPVLVGEWSLGLPHRAFRGLDDFEHAQALKAFARLQQEAFTDSKGWFFWTYKTENMEGWDFRTCIDRGWLEVST